MLDHCGGGGGVQQRVWGAEKAWEGAAGGRDSSWEANAVPKWERKLEVPTVTHSFIHSRFPRAHTGSGTVPGFGKAAEDKIKALPHGAYVLRLSHERLSTLSLSWSSALSNARPMAPPPRGATVSYASSPAARKYKASFSFPLPGESTTCCLQLHSQIEGRLGPAPEKPEENSGDPG